MNSETSRIRQRLALFFSVLILAGCMGKNYRPVVDPKGVNMSNFEQDLVECQNIAGQVSIVGESAGTALVGATAGATVGAIGGAIFGDAGTGAASGAVYGGGTGAVDGAVSGLHGQEQVVAKCMTGRGYKVLRYCSVLVQYVG